MSRIKSVVRTASLRIGIGIFACAIVALYVRWWMVAWQIALAGHIVAVVSAVVAWAAS
mgnify:FL=1